MFANQIALLEAIAKSIPLGYTLVVKEHPGGRGSRPAWQYRHLLSFPNVMFCDARSIDIARQCETVITITGTIGMEAMAIDRPVIIFGDCYYDYSELLYKTKSFAELPQLFRRILIDGEYLQRTDRLNLIRKTLLSFLLGIVPGAQTPENAAIWATEILKDVKKEQVTHEPF